MIEKKFEPEDVLLTDETNLDSEDYLNKTEKIGRPNNDYFAYFKTYLGKMFYRNTGKRIFPDRG